MFRQFVLISLILKAFSQCSLRSGFIFPSIEESYSLSGAVLEGTVKEHVKNGFIIPYIIKLESVVYHKGCGPSEVTVKGYTSGSMCGISAPDVGSKIFVFVCKDDGSSDWKLNRFTSFAGQFEYNEKNLQEVQQLSSKNGKCADEDFKFETCTQKRIQKSFEEPKLLHQPTIKLLINDEFEEES